jgi:hypothetical protein
MNLTLGYGSMFHRVGDNDELARPEYHFAIAELHPQFSFQDEK